MALRPRRSLSTLWALVVAFGATLLLASRAGAEEAFVLDNGAVLRGTVIREDDREIVFKLDGIGRDGRVTIEKSRIAQRFVTKDPRDPVRGAASPASEVHGPGEAPLLASYLPGSSAARSGASAPLAPMIAHASELPDEEPTAKDENFFQRTARRALIAAPRSAGMRAALVALGIALLLALVEIGGRMVDIDGLSLGKSTTLALLLGLLVALDVLASDSLLRADRAPVIIIAQLLAWVGCAAAVLRCGIASAFQLIAFVLFAGALVALVTGALLVTI